MILDEYGKEIPKKRPTIPFRPVKPERMDRDNGDWFTFLMCVMVMVIVALETWAVMRFGK